MKSAKMTKAQRAKEAGATRRRTGMSKSDSGRKRSEKIQAALYKIAERASAGLEMQEFYAAMHRIVGELMYAKSFYILLHDEKTNIVTPDYWRDASGDAPAPPVELSAIPKRPSAIVIREGRVLHLSRDQVQQGIRRGELDPYGTISEDLVVVPLKTEERTLGAIVVQSYEKGVGYTDEDVEVLTFVAQHIATALSRARAIEETRQRVAELEIINAVSQGLASKLDIQAIYDLVGDKIREIFDAQSVLIVTFDYETELGHINYSYEKGERYYPPPRPLSESPLSRLMNRVRQPVLLVRKEQFGEYGLATIPGTEPAKSAVFVPLVTGDKVKGAISIQNVDRENAFSESDVRLLTTLASPLSIALQNARLFDELQTRNREITEALEQQTATSEILRVIASSPTEIQPMLDAVAERAARLSGSDDAAILRVEGDFLRLVAHHGPIPVMKVGEEGLPLNRGSVTGRAVIDRKPIHVHDLAQESEEEFPVGREAQKRFGHRTTFATPLLREGIAIGAIVIRRLQVRPLTEKQIELLKTFADQAMIAIENVRLFNELQARNRDLTEALEQQTATSEILRVIASSPTNIQPVLDTVAENAARLCAANDVQIYKVEGKFLRQMTHYGPLPALPAGEALPLVPGLTTGRAVLERRTIHIEDAQKLSESEFPDSVEIQKRLKHRTLLSTPLLRERNAIGAIVIRRNEVRPFTEKQIALLKTFADQAAIAIENVRLFNELQTRNREITEALERQTATSEILRVIASTPTDVQPVFDAIVERAVQLCGASFGTLHLVRDGQLDIVAQYHTSPETAKMLQGLFPRPLDAKISNVSRVILDRELLHVTDVENDSRLTQVSIELSRASGGRSLLIVPLLKDGKGIGTVLVSRRETGGFTSKQIALLQTFADQAVIAIENVRLFNELQTRNREITEALEQQTATSEILRVIASSPTDVQPIFDAIVERVLRLCDGLFSSAYRVEGDQLHLVAHRGYIGEALDALVSAYPKPLDRETSIGSRVILDRQVIHIPDIESEPKPRWMESGAQMAMVIGGRSWLCVPLIKDGRGIGAITVGRKQPEPFTEKQIALLQTFADQAVIAMENISLFNELQTRHREITEALKQQTATSEILRVMASTPTDVQPVLDAVAENAARLCDSYDASIARIEGNEYRIVAHWGPMPDAARDHGQGVPLSRDSVTGRAMLDRQTIHVHDVLAEPEGEYVLSKQFGNEDKQRTILSVPLVREGESIGAIFLRRQEVRPFSEKQIALLKTFSDQAVIAIENVRLFNELQARNRDLTEALEQQTATSEILRVIASSPTEIQPVLDAVAENAARVCGANDAVIFRLDSDTLLSMAHFGPLPITSSEEGIPLRRGSIAGRAAIDLRTVHIHDVLAESDAEFPISKALHKSDGVRTILATPLLREGAPIGVIAIRRAEMNPFTEKQIALLKTFADQAVIAIENVRLFNETRQRAAELAIINSVGQALASQLELNALIELVGKKMRETFDAQIVYIALLNRETNQIDFPYYDDQGRPRTGPPLVFGQGLTSKIIQSRQPLLINNEQQIVAMGIQRIGAPSKSYLGVPIMVGDEAIGVISVQNVERESAFSESDVRLLTTIASNVGIALQNARLFGETQSQKQFFEAVVLNSPVAIVIVGLDGKTVSWNPAAEKLFGYARAEVIGRDIDDLIALSDEIRAEAEACSLRAARGELYHSITRRNRKDGSLVDVELSVVPVQVAGVRVGTIAIYHDITELVRARKEAETANQAKSAFLATMSHEIRTPMNAVIGMSNLLLDTNLSGDQREYAGIIRNSGDALLTVINDILDFSKIEAGKMELENAPLDLRDCVESALDLLAPQAAEKGLDLAYRIEEGTPAAIVGDVTRLRQILINLLNNAVKFTEKGEVVLTVKTEDGRPKTDGVLSFSLRPPSSVIRFSVHDTGIGIASDQMSRLFESFSQADTSTARKYGGTGLGLAISKRLCELMGGTMWAESEGVPGKGSTFHFTIAAQAAPDFVTRDYLRGEQPPLSGKQLLIVDDNDINRQIVIQQTRAWGMRVRDTRSAAEALEWIRRGDPFDIAILDMHMPEMDGVTLATEIRKHRDTKTLPLVIFSSLGRRETPVGMELFAANLIKPIKPSQLFDALIGILGGQTAHPQKPDKPSLDPEMSKRLPLHILLAEDNVVNQKLAIRLLGQMGYRADVAANGQEAIDALERQRYDVVLMDVQMPEMDGLEASRRISQRWARESRPRIIAMTANAMQGDREMCLQAGMDDYISKPIRVDELMSALNRVGARS